MPSATPDGSNRGGLGREITCRAVANLNPAADLSRSASLPLLCRFFAHSFCNARAQKCLESCPTVKTVKETQQSWGRHVGITDWLLVWLIANALFVVWRVLVVSQAESRDLAVRREGAGQPLSQRALRARLLQ
jgi:hypothetical protein